MNIKKIMLVLACILTLALCSTVSAAETTNNTNYSAHLQSSTSININNSQAPDPIISGVVKDNSTNKGLTNVTIKVIQNNVQVAETKTRSDGTYSVNFTNSNTNFIIIASKLGYMPFSKTITVTHSSNPNDTNLYGTANFRLYTLLKYRGSASSYVLNVGALPQILLDVYAGKSSAWVNSTAPNNTTGGGTPLEVKLLTGSLLAGLLDVYSTGDNGAKIGGLLPANNATLNSLLHGLGIDVGLLNATSNSSANPPAASGTSEVASLNVGIQLLLSLLSLNADVITSDSSVLPNFNTGILVSSSHAGVADIALTLLGIPLLEIEALQSNAIASVNGKPGGATAKFTWKVADIKSFGISILNDLTLNGHVNIGLLGLNILTLSLGSVEDTTSADGTYAKASGDALRLQVLGILGGGLINLIIGHAEAEAQVPSGGLHVNTADIGIIKTANNKHPNYLQNVTFTLTAHNYGPNTATGIIVTDKLPTGLKFISSNGNYNSSTGVWTIGNLANGQEAVLKIIAQVIASNTQITNLASITGNSYDPEPGNDESSATVTVNPASDVGITKTVNNSHPNYLQNVTFTLTAHNYGPDTATSVKVTDKLPSGLKFISANGNGIYNSTSGIWSIGNLANGKESILNIIAQIISSNTQITNIAGINGTNYDQNSTNNESNSTVTIDPASDLEITKTVNNSHPNYLDKVTFTITAHNYGPDTTTGITVTDKLPTGLKFISTKGNGTYNPVTGIWTIGSLTKGSNVVLEIIAQVIASNTQITNIATINGTNYDQNSTNNQSNATITVNPASDLGITKTVDNTHPNYLQNVTFTLTAHNYGPDTATGVTVADKLPAGLKFISANGNGIYNSTSGIWTIGNLANGKESILNIIAQVIASNTQITNIAEINGINYDQNSTNNKSNSTVTIDPASDLEITKTVDKTAANYLDKIHYTLTVTNHGPNQVNNITVNDNLPDSIQWISDNSNSAYNHVTGIWTINTLLNGKSITLNILAQIVKSNTIITNIATVNNNTYDQNSTNNQDQTTTTVKAASDINITKTVDNKHPHYLQNVKFTLAAHNYGPDTATGVTVTDKLPTGLKFISSNGNYNPKTGVWTIGNLANGKEAILEIIAQVIASNTQITNIAEINGTNYDQNSTNNKSNTTVTVNPASDLKITKTVDNSHPKYLQKVTFTLTAHNYGPNNATGVKVTDKLPAGLKFISVSGNGTYNSSTGAWTIRNLANGANAILKIITQAITANTQVTNIAVINGTNYDQNSTNDQSNATVNIGPASDLGITITVNNAHPKYLDYVTFTLTAHNYGPSNAAYVKVYNTLPAKLRYVSDDSNGAFNPVFNSTTGLWTIGYMANGATAMLHIVAQATASNVTLTDVASITDPDPVGATDFYDPNQSNDQASVTLNVDPVTDLSITKTVNNLRPNYLQNVTFTLVAHNNGPNKATMVKVIDKLPRGLKFISANGDGTYNSTSGIWTIRNLSKGADAILNIIAQVVTSGTKLTNTASITGCEIDLNSANNKANVTMNIGAASDLGITKTVNNARPKYLQNVTFTLTAHNYGPNTATGVKVTDKLPSGLKFISANGNGIYNSTSGVWTIGNLANGSNAVLKIVAQTVTPNITVTNIATINGTHYDQKSSNNKGNATVTIGPAADLAVTMSVNNANPKYLQKVTFTITAYNYGPMNAKNVTVTLKMPAGFKYVSNDRSVQYNPKTGVWTIGNLKNGGKIVLHIVEQAVVSNVKLTSTATIKGTAIMM